MVVERFSAPRAAQAIGCTYRQLDYWVRAGVLAPVVAARGSGSIRYFSLHDVAVGRAVQQLRSLGAQGDTLVTAAHNLAAIPLDGWTGPVVVTTTGEVVDLEHGTQLRQPGWLVRLDRCTRSVERTLAA